MINTANINKCDFLKRVSNTLLDGEPPIKVSKHHKRFQESWFEEFPSWNDWVLRVADDTKFHCKFCNKTMSCWKSEIRIHESSDRHQINCNRFEKMISYGMVSENNECVDFNSGGVMDINTNKLNMEIDCENYNSVVNENQTSIEYTTEIANGKNFNFHSFKDKVREAEIRIATFFLEHNVSFNISTELVGLFQDIAATVLKSVKLSKTKLINIANNVVCSVEEERISSILRKQSFSVYEDETSDNTQQKWLSLLIRYVEMETLQVRSELLEIINLDASDCSSSKIFDAFEKSLVDKKISLYNIAGLACDNASVMVGKKSSFKTRLLEKSPNSIIVPCVAHSVATAAKNACDTIPYVDSLVKKIPAFLNASPKRTAIFRSIVEEEEDYHKIPSHAETQWLVRHKCISIIIQHWDYILQFLQELASIRKPELKAINLLTIMKEPITFGYFLFLHYSLEVFNRYNATFQKRETMIQELQPRSAELLATTLGSFLKQEFLKPELFLNVVKNLDLSNTENHKALEDLDVGFKTRDYLKSQLSLGKIGKEDADKFLQNCLQFYITAGEEIRERLPFDNLFLGCVSIFRPKMAMSCNANETIGRVWQVCKTLGIPVDIFQVKKEGSDLPSLCHNVKEQWSKLSFDEMSIKIGLSCNTDGKSRFPSLTRLLNRIRVLPHSNAEAERGFSMLKDAKTSKRNRLGSRTINSILVIRSVLIEPVSF